MTDTRITVDVSTEALLQRARQQQAQSRQAAIQREEERKEVERQKREARKAGRDQPPGQDRLRGRSKLRGMAPRHEVAAGYVPAPVLCLAVLDETDALTPEEIESKWIEFRQKYGKKRDLIVLCVSYPGYGQDVQAGFVQTYPDVFDELVGIPFPMPYQQVRRYRVTRNNKRIPEDPEPEPPTVWQNVARQQLLGRKTILLSVDNSGSMYLENVQDSYDSFVAWATGRGIKLYAADMKGTEDYITPFDAQINDLERIYPS